MTPSDSIFPVARIVSGGQTGADRGGLDAAIELKIPHGGWCPKGRKAEDRVIPNVYQLNENNSGDYRVRTEANVVESDATIIFTHGPLDGGSLLTAQFAKKHDRPWLHLNLADDSQEMAVKQFRSWLRGVGQGIVLNVAGQRESKSPGLQAEVREFLLNALKRGEG